MASIVSSEIVMDVLQKDGRRSVLERHTDDQGNVFEYGYLADPGMDINARLLARVSIALADAEQQQMGG